MLNLYKNTTFLDENANKILGLNNEILMENAASKIEKIVRKKLKKGAKILALLGSGNNAGDAICALRKLSGDYECLAYKTTQKLNEMLEFQSKIAKSAGVKVISDINQNFDCIIDGIYASGFKGALSAEISSLLNEINCKKALKIAVDIPSGIDENGNLQNAFKADFTIVMGALKMALFSDASKDFVGKIKVANLGISRHNFELPSDMFVLEKSDLSLPFRTKHNAHKGNFGHAYVFCGDMKGASVIAALSANAIGAGLVSIISDENLTNLSPILMQKKSLNNAKFLLIGPGLGDKNVDFSALCDKILVIDADMCHKSQTISLIKTNPNFVITPHPKEFCALLKLAKIAEISVDELQQNRFKFARLWSQNFSGVLVLKGANTIIAHNDKLYVSTFGKPNLAKSGSGDVLSGLILGLLAQHYSPLNAAISGVIAHAFAARKFRKNSYSLNPFDLIEMVKIL